VNRKTLLLVALVLSGCSSAQVRIELDHDSHPFDGVPFGPRTEEDSLTQVSGIASWRHGRAYVEVGTGYNLRGRNGGGFYGSPWTGTARAGWVIKERSVR
jgi:hypothetical protein